MAVKGAAWSSASDDDDDGDDDDDDDELLETDDVDDDVSEAVKPEVGTVAAAGAVELVAAGVLLPLPPLPWWLPPDERPPPW